MPYQLRPYVPAKDPLTAIPPSRHPFQIWVMTAFMLSGAANFFTGGSDVVQQSIDPFFHKIWAVTLFAGGFLALMGAFWRDRVTALLLERTGLTAVGISCPTYGVMFLTQTDWTQGIGGVLTITIGIAALWRVIHVNRELRIVRNFIEQAGMR